MSSRQQKNLTLLLEQEMNGLGDTAYGAYQAQITDQGMVPYMDDFSLGEANPHAGPPAAEAAAIDAQTDADKNKVLMWGAAAVVAFLLLGPK